MADLFVVIRGSSVRQLNLILEAGGNVNVQNERLETPLMFTLINVKDLEKRSAVISALIKFGADVNIQNARGQTAFMYACILNQVQSLSILLGQKNIKVNLQDSEGNTGLMYACALGNTKTVQKLLEEHVSRRQTFKFTVENHEGLTALQYAEDGYFVDIVSMLSEIISLPSYTRPVKSTETTNKPGIPDQKPTPRTKFTKTALNKTNNVTEKQKEPEMKTMLKVPEKESSVSSDLNKRELDEINDLVRSVRQCAADIKQICTDHDIDYKGEKKKRNGDSNGHYQGDSNGTGGWNEKPRKRSKMVVSESVMSLGDMERNDNRTNIDTQDNMRSSTYPRRYKPRSRQMGVPNITFGESSDAMTSDSSSTHRNKYKPSFVSKSRFRLEDVSDMSAPFFKPVSKEKIQARISNRLEVPTEPKRPVSQKGLTNKHIDPQPRSMSTSLEMEKGMLSRSIGPTIDEVQPLLNKIWSSYKVPLPSISNTNSPSNEQQELRLPPLRESLQNSPRGERQTPIKIQNIEKDFLSPKARLRINKNN